MAAVRKLSFVLWTAPFLPEYKLSPQLTKKPLTGFEPSKVRASIEKYYASTIHDIKKAFEASNTLKLSFQVEDGSILVSFPETQDLAEVADWLAEQPQVHWVEPVSIMTTHAKWAVPLVTATAVAPTTPLTGANQKVAVVDTGVSNTCYLAQGRVTQVCDFVTNCADASGHGTAMASLVGGVPTGNAADFKGAATAAQIVSIALPTQTDAVEGNQITLPTNIGDVLNKAKANNANVVVAGFGGSDLMSYSTASQSVDQFTSANPNILVVFPAGNSGPAGTVANPASAKNSLTVGATQNTLNGLVGSANFTPAIPIAQQTAIANLVNIATNFSTTFTLNGEGVLSSFSARGPTFDGRAKPDLVAPGERIGTSGLNDACTGNPTAVSGTSYAAAIAAGAAAQVREYLASGYWRTGSPTTADSIPDAPAALVKAIMINSGQALMTAAQGAVGTTNGVPLRGLPEYHAGFGRLSLGSNLKFGTAGKNLWLTQSLPNVSTASTNVVCFSVSAGGSFKATLVWHDPAASPATSQALVNDLDLIVTNRASGRVYRSNGLRVRDSWNNVEQVSNMNTLASAATFGAYVTGINVPVGTTQSYALVISGDITAADCAASATFACPGSCGAAGTCGANGVCVCNAGFTGADCSASACPGNGCRSQQDPTIAQGICDVETSLCTCFKNFSGVDCNTPVAVRYTYVSTQSTLSQGQMIGAAVGAGIFGLVVGGVVGWFIAIKYLEHQRRKKREHLMRGGDEGM